MLIKVGGARVNIEWVVNWRIMVLVILEMVNLTAYSNDMVYLLLN